MQRNMIMVTRPSISDQIWPKPANRDNRLTILTSRTPSPPYIEFNR